MADAATATLIDGKAVAEGLRARIAGAVPAVVARLGREPGLATVLVGEDPASHVYVRNKVRQTEAAGMVSFHHPLPATASRADILALVERLNRDPAVDGILVQLPLPQPGDEAAVINALDPDKDVDGFHVVNVGRLATGQAAFAPCTPYGCLLLLRHAGIDLAGRRALVVGRSNIVGKPMAQLLLAQSATVTIAHSRTTDLADECRRADILVAAVGRPGMIRGDWIKPGAAVIDVGINRVPAPDKGAGATRLVGDVDFAGASRVAGAITPVPGGVGPMTIACLLRNTLVAACRRAGIDPPDVDG